MGNNTDNRYRRGGKLVVRSTLLGASSPDSFDASNNVLWMLKGGEREQTENMLVGEVAHCLLLEKDNLDKRYVFYDGAKNGAEYKRKRIECMQFKDIKLVPSKVHDRALAMHKTLLDFLQEEFIPGEFLNLLANGRKEEELSYEEGGHIELIKPDAFNQKLFMDYKTTSLKAVDRCGWREHLTKYNMHIQLGFYYKVLKRLEELGELPGYDIVGAYHLVQSSVAPYFCALFFFGQKSLENGRLDAEVALSTVLEISAEAEKVGVIELDSVQDIGKFFVSSEEWMAYE